MKVLTRKAMLIATRMHTPNSITHIHIPVFAMICASLSPSLLFTETNMNAIPIPNPSHLPPFLVNPPLTYTLTY